MACCRTCSGKPQLVARMERSEIRDSIEASEIPGFRCAPSGLRVEYRRPRQFKMPEQVHECRQALFAPRVDVLVRIIEKAGAGSHADAAGFHVARNYLRRAVAVAVQGAFEVAA